MTADRPLLPYGRQWIDDDDVAAVTAVLRSPWLTTGPVVERFEQAFAERVGARYAVACSSGTAGLHLSYLALGLQPGDHVVVPTLTFAATANAVRYVGAEVVFADVDPSTGLMRRENMVAAIYEAQRSGSPVKAVSPVHLNGQTENLEVLGAEASSRGLAMVEDACHAIGTLFVSSNGERHPVGDCRYGDATVFSLHPVKTVTMGEGGVVTTNDPAIYQRLKRLRGHGIDHCGDPFEHVDLALDARRQPNPWYYELAELGYNYRASDLHCALGLSQLGKLDDFAARRRRLAECYDRELAPLAPVVRPVARVSGCEPVWHLYVVLIDFEALAIDRAELMRRLRIDGIGSQVHYLPLHLHPYYRRRYGTLRLPGAEAYYARCLSLPLFPAMDESEVKRVAAALGDCLEGAGA